jgi:hypothetical protein
MPSTYTPISTATTSGSTSSVTFSSIPSTYTDLILICSSKAAAGYLIIRVNSDSSSNYSRTNLIGTGSSAISNRASNQSFLLAPDAGTSEFYPTITQFMNYSSTTTFKTALQRTHNMGSNVYATVGLWRSTSAITSITVQTDDASNISSGSTFTLYGIKEA